MMEVLLIVKIASDSEVIMNKMAAAVVSLLRKVAAPLLIHPLEIGVLQQMRALGETALRCVAHAGIHGARVSKLRFRRPTLIAMTRAYRDPLASLGPPPRQHSLAAFGLHALPEAVHLGTPAAVRLECPLRHLTPMLLSPQQAKIGLAGDPML